MRPTRTGKASGPRRAHAGRSTRRWRLLDTVRAAGDTPATFLLDEFLELRTFESFPGLRSVLRDLLDALASSGNRFVLTTRYTARAHRLLRDAPAQFEIVHVAPLTPAEIRATMPAALRPGTCRAIPRTRTTARATSSRGSSTRFPMDVRLTRA